MTGDTCGRPFCADCAAEFDLRVLKLREWAYRGSTLARIQEALR